MGGFGWLWVVVGGFGSFLVLVCTEELSLNVTNIVAEMGHS